VPDLEELVAQLSETKKKIGGFEQNEVMNILTTLLDSLHISIRSDMSPGGHRHHPKNSFKPRNQPLLQLIMIF
jgi:imidazoleglycerol phosphate dehydratase HisB